IVPWLDAEPALTVLPPVKDNVPVWPMANSLVMLRVCLVPPSVSSEVNPPPLASPNWSELTEVLPTFRVTTSLATPELMYTSLAATGSPRVHLLALLQISVPPTQQSLPFAHIMAWIFTSFGS